MSISEMDCKVFSCVILCSIFVFSVADLLRLTRQRPSTVWGVQKQFFRQKIEKEYFKSKTGTYHFKYDTGFADHQSFRNERRYPNGTVVGFFGYVDPEGVLRITEYVAGRFGYRQRTVLRVYIINVQTFLGGEIGKQMGHAGVLEFCNLMFNYL